MLKRREKDVKTPYENLSDHYHAVNGVANCRETRFGKAAFEATFPTTAPATAEHVQATADDAAKVPQGMVIVRTLDGIVRNVYSADPGKLAAWISASHVEKAPKKQTP